MIFTYNTSLVRGRARVITFTVRYPTGDPLGRGGLPIDLTAATVTGTIRTDDKAAPLITLDNLSNGGITILDQTGVNEGQFQWAPKASSTTPLVAGTYRNEISVNMNDGSDPFQVLWPSDLVVI